MSTLRRRIMVLGCGGEDFVDLDLPSGMLWAKGNIVSDGRGGYRVGDETDYGALVSWGNIEPHFNGDGYRFNNTNYNASPGKSVTADIPTNDALHDAAFALLGRNCHLPSKEDFSELSLYTDNEYTTINNVKGWKFMKKTDHSVYIFFPCAGYGGDSSYSGQGTQAYYWSSGWYSSAQAYRLTIVRGTLTANEYSTRRFGHSVRAVCKPLFSITITIEGEDVEGITVTVRDLEGISHSGTTNSNGVVRLTGVANGSAKVFTKDYYVTNSRITVNASSRTFTCGLEQRESKYLTFYSITDCTHKFTKAVNYSLDGGTTWRSLSANTNLTVPTGSSVMWKATLSSGSSGIGTFSVTSTSMRFDVEGNPMSLMYGDNFIEHTDLTGKNYAFFNMFSNNRGVTDAQNMALPATTLAERCYGYMFSGCTSLVTAPTKLPATTLANYCYINMFSGCTSLVTAPELPATTLTRACYLSMFKSCSSLTTPPELPATTLAIDCYEEMFYICTSLASVPELPATTLADDCYLRMFCLCSNLTSVPELPATTLASNCYLQMFSGCSSLVSIHNDLLPATTLATNCYQEMFQGCKNLTTVPSLPSTTLALGCYKGMFYGTQLLPDCTNIDFLSQTVLQNGGLVGLFAGTKLTNNDLDTILRQHGITNYSLPATILEDSCYSMMFEGCTNLTTAPNLPATTLAPYCYAAMFRDCTNLTSAPILRATTLNEGCYEYMFNGCTSLTTVSSLPATTLADYCYEYMFQECTSLTTVPSNLLPATTLANSCYQQMFEDCTSLTRAPELPATTLVNNCYAYMFNNCSNLNYIKCMATDISTSNYLYYWVNNVAASGTFVKASSMSSWPTGESGIPSGWTVQNT